MTLQEYVNSLKNKSVAVIGIGVSNTPLIRRLCSDGIDVTACDKRTVEELGDLAIELTALGAKLQLGADYLDHLTQDVIFRTPGLRHDVPQLKAAVERGAVLTSEMEVFFEICACPIIAVTGSDGKKRDATKCLIIFTSNIGVRSAKEMSSPLGFTSDVNKKKDQKKEDIIRKALNKRFSPEFLNRLDGICYFNSLDTETLTKILYKELDEMNENIKAITGKEVRITKNVENWLIDKVETEDNGARPIIRMLQQDIEEEIADLYVEEDPRVMNNKKIINVDLVDDEITIM